MATVVLGAAGTAVGGPLGGAIGATVGSYLDQEFIFPELFGEPIQEGPRVDDFQMGTAAEGSPIIFCQGPENKIAGTAIWMSDVEEVKTTQEQGGKGGGGGVKSTTYTYFADIAIAVCEGEVQNISKIWAGGKIVFEEDNDIALSGSDVSVTAIASGYFGNSLMRLNSPALGTDLSLLRSGIDVTLTGFANGGNNGTFRAFTLAGDQTSPTELVLINVNRVTEAAGASVTLAQVIPDTDPTQAKSVTIHKGTEAQVADPIIEAFEGVGNVPGFKFIAYVVIERFALADYGNRLPVFQFFVEKDTSITVASAVQELVLRSGRVAAEVDVTAVSAGNLRGYALRGPQAMQKALQPMMLAHDIVMRESSKVMIFQQRASPDTRTVLADDLAAHDPDSDVPRVASINDDPGLNIPQEVDVEFIDGENEYQTGSQRERRIDSPADNVARLRFPIVMAAPQARSIAARELWTPQANRQRVVLSLPPSYLQVEENDLVTFTAYGETFNVRVMQIERGHNNMLMLNCVVEQLHTLTQVSVADLPAGAAVQTVPVPQAMVLDIADIAPLLRLHSTNPGAYFSTAGADTREPWRQAQLFRSEDDSAFTFIETVPLEATMGESTTILGTGPVGYFDEVGTVDVVLFAGALESANVAQVRSGANFALLGNEMIQYRSAVLIAALTYRLTGLLRGRMDTADEIGGHVAVERFIALNRGGFRFIELEESAIGTTRFYRSVAVGENVANEQSHTLAFAGNSIRPFSPAHADGARDGSNNLTITWLRVTRSPIRLLSGTLVPLLEAVEEYEVDILDAPGGTVLRTIEITAETASYTAAEQTTDGLTPGDLVDVEIFQLSRAVGRSKPLVALV